MLPGSNPEKVGHLSPHSQEVAVVPVSNTIYHMWYELLAGIAPSCLCLVVPRKPGGALWGASRLKRLGDHFVGAFFGSLRIEPEQAIALLELMVVEDVTPVLQAEAATVEHRVSTR